MSTFDPAALRALLDAATPAPWSQEYKDSDIIHGPNGTVAETMYVPADAELIAALRNQMPGLLDELDRARLRDEACHRYLDLAKEELHHLSRELAETERERDLLGRQHQALLDLTAKHRWAVRVKDLHQVLITDPGDDDTARYVDFTYSADGSKGLAWLQCRGGHTLFELDRQRLREFIDMAVSTYRFLTGGPDHCGLCGREECSGLAGDPDGCMPGPFEEVEPAVPGADEQTEPRAHRDMPVVRCDIVRTHWAHVYPVDGEKVACPGLLPHSVPLTDDAAPVAGTADKQGAGGERHG